MLYCSTSSHTSSTCIAYCPINLPETWLLGSCSPAHILFDLEGTPYFSPIYWSLFLTWLLPGAQRLFFWSLWVPLLEVPSLKIQLDFQSLTWVFIMLAESTYIKLFRCVRLFLVAGWKWLLLIWVLSHFVSSFCYTLPPRGDNTG